MKFKNLLIVLLFFSTILMADEVILQESTRKSVLVPQVMLYGFLGFRPTIDGFAVDPTLPKDWPSLLISDIHIHDWVLDITAEQSGRVRFRMKQPGSRRLTARIRDREIFIPANSPGAEFE